MNIHEARARIAAIQNDMPASGIDYALLIGDQQGKSYTIAMGVNSIEGMIAILAMIMAQCEVGLIHNDIRNVHMDEIIAEAKDLSKLVVQDAGATSNLIVFPGSHIKP